MKPLLVSEVLTSASASSPADDRKGEGAVLRQELVIELDGCRHQELDAPVVEAPRCHHLDVQVLPAGHRSVTSEIVQHTT
jgi:hypothetical protein